RLHSYPSFGGIYLDNLVHALGKIDYHRMSHGLTGKAGSSTPGKDGNFEVAGQLDGGIHIFLADGNDNCHRPDLIYACVCGVHPPAIVVAEDFPRQRPFQLSDNIFALLHGHDVIIVSNAPSNMLTWLALLLLPISPMRQILPAKSPRPPPTSILNSSSSCLRWAVSFSAGGNLTAFNIGSRYSGSTTNSKPSCSSPSRSS